MQPDNLTSSKQGTGNRNSDKTGKTVSREQLSAEDRAEEGVKRGPSEDAPEGNTEPHVRHPNRTAQNSEGGNFKGPDKGRVRR